MYLGREKVSESKCDLVKVKSLYRNYLLKFFRKGPESALTGETF
jgi:hypothetical protein